MARVTVEDCVLKVPNRFELVMLAAQRARDISSGASLTVDRDNDKNPVVALREIADTTIDMGALENSVVQGLRRHVETEETVEDTTFGEGDLLGEVMETAPDSDLEVEGEDEEEEGEEDETEDLALEENQAGGEELPE